MKNIFSKNMRFIIFYWSFINFCSFASNIEKNEDIFPLNYIKRFTISPQKASDLLKPHWSRGNKEKLAEQLNIVSSTLKLLIDDIKPNKALRAFNLALIENNELWEKIFSTTRDKTQIIFDQLIRDTSDIAVAEQLGVSVSELQNFQENSKSNDIFKLLPKVSIDNWPYEIATQSNAPLSSAEILFDQDYCASQKWILTGFGWKNS